MTLIVNGALQVGKSYILQEFGRMEFENYLIVNLETDKALVEKFDEFITPFLFYNTWNQYIHSELFQVRH